MIQIPDSIVLRTSLLFSILTATVVLIMGMVVRISVDNHFIEIDKQQMAGKLELVQNLLAEMRKPTDLPIIRQQLENALVGHHDLIVHISDVNGTDIFNDEHIIIPKNVLQKNTSIPQMWSANGIFFRSMNTVTPNGYHITVGLDITHHQLFLHEFELHLLWIGVCGTLSMAVLGWFAARRGLRPVSDMTKVAARISAQQLSERLIITQIPVELHSLAISFNDMLDRLGSSLERLTEFSSDIAHELRTPINNLMTQTQVSLTKTRDAEAYREILYTNLEEFERLARMIADMLFLAKSDHQLIIPTEETINLSHEVMALFEFYEALAHDNRVTFSVSGNAHIKGDRLMLRRALSNLLANAIQHSYEESVIEVKLEKHPETGFAKIIIENRGDTINAEHIPRLFDRFYRTDSSRQRHHEGVGLGLAITQSIIQTHGGKISVTSLNEITQFEILLPTADF